MDEYFKQSPDRTPADRPKRNTGCPNCGAEITAYDTICPRCGKNLKNRKLFMMAAIIVIAVVIIVKISFAIAFS